MHNHSLIKGKEGASLSSIKEYIKQCKVLELFLKILFSDRAESRA